MRLYVDLETLQLIEGPGFRNPVTSLRFKRGDAAQLEVTFLTSGTTATQIGDPATLDLQFGIKPRGRYDVGYLVHTSDWTLPAQGAPNPSYLCAPSFNTAELDSAMQVGSSTGTELSEITLMGEITWREGAGKPSSTRTFTVLVENDVIRGTEGTPLELPTPEEWLAGQIAAGVTNPTGVATNIDKLLLENVRAGQQVLINGEGNRVEQYLGSVAPPDFVHVAENGGNIVLARQDDIDGKVAYANGSFTLKYVPGVYPLGGAWVLENSGGNQGWIAAPGDEELPWEAAWLNGMVYYSAGAVCSGVTALWPIQFTASDTTGIMGARDANYAPEWVISDGRVQPVSTTNEYFLRWENAGGHGAGWYVYDDGYNECAYSLEDVEFPWEVKTWLPGSGADETPVTLSAPTPSAWEDNWADVIPSYEVTIGSSVGDPVTLNGVTTIPGATTNIGWMKPGFHHPIHGSYAPFDIDMIDNVPSMMNDHYINRYLNGSAKWWVLPVLPKVRAIRINQ